MTAMPGESPLDAASQRLKLVGKLLVKERHRLERSAEQQAEFVGLSKSTYSKAENGKPGVGPGAWFDIGRALGWGDYLDFVMIGDVEAVQRYDNVDDEINKYAVLMLRRIAEQ